MASSKLRMFYFPIIGRTEVIRLVLALAGKQYEEVRVTMEEWPKLKPTAPFRKLPIMEIDGKKYGQTLAIATFLAKEFGFYGKTNLDGLKIDMVGQLLIDFTHAFEKRFGLDKDAKAVVDQRLKEKHGPRFLGYFEQLLIENGTGYVTGNCLTLADIILFDMCTGFLAPYVKDHMDGFPMVKQLVEKVESIDKIKAYMATRTDLFPARMTPPRSGL